MLSKYNVYLPSLCVPQRNQQTKHKSPTLSIHDKQIHSQEIGTPNRKYYSCPLKRMSLLD